MVNRGRQIYIVGAANDYANWMNGELTDRFENASLIVFTGGEDVTPSLYNAPAHPKSYFNEKRDKVEMIAFKKAQELKIPCVGICRGSQFLCVMSGGSLVQHQENPLYMHNIETYDNNILQITSTHHQAQYPYELSKDNYNVLAWSKGISRFHEDGNMKELPLPEDKEAEIVYYKNTNCLGIQGHPEMMFTKNKTSETILYLQSLLTKFILGGLDTDPKLKTT